MKKFRNLLERLKGLTGAAARYPFTLAFLLAAAVFLAVSIHTDKDQIKPLLSCAVGAFLCGAAQAAFERFFRRPGARFLLSGGSAVLALGYYLIVRQAPELSMEIEIRTSVALLALFFAYIWLPAIRSETGFCASFMAAFKAFFHSVLYSAVIFGGCSLILTAVDTLIAPISHKAFAYTADAVFVLFAPLFFLSLIPVYPGEGDGELAPEEKAGREERIRKATFCPRFLEVLLSYIVIPLTAVFTVILVLYIALNITGPFWTNNLLEPLLVSYAVTVILVTILTGRLENSFALFFRRIFPKVLIPIVVFQIVASVLSLREMGVTHTRYFVILFGAFAACSGVVLSFFPVRKYGLVAALLILFSAVSVIPPFDAFSVSFRSQESLLRTTLEQNGMLSGETITPDGSIPDAEKQKIVSSAEYLNRMNYLGKVSWLPEGFELYKDFYETFGFHPYDLPQKTGRYISVYLNRELSIDVAGYDVMASADLSGAQTADAKICEIQHAGNSYVLTKTAGDGAGDLVLTGGDGGELIRFHTADLYTRYLGYAGEVLDLSAEEATFTQENDQVRLTVVVQNASMQSSGTSPDYDSYYANLYIFIRFK